MKKQRSAATPKLKVPGSTKLAAASKSMIYVTILLNFLIHELNKFTSIESPSQYFFILQMTIEIVFLMRQTTEEKVNGQHQEVVSVHHQVW